MNKRQFLSLSILSATTALPFFGSKNSFANTMKEKPPLVPHPEKLAPFKLDDAEWRMRLSKEAYYVLREEGTERPYSSELNEEKREGEYVCAGCNLALFESSKKYESGTGWPSFWAPIESHIETKRDFKLILPRTEYHCARCGGHQGHLFKDGPKPTGLRYCNNGVALNFIPA
jgi:peptide-methionine (R)-S-oxide reductase